MDGEQQFFADGLTGLRGYRAHAFAGSRAIVINIEERLYLGREILQLASPGIVAFADAGNAIHAAAPATTPVTTMRTRFMASPDD